MTQDILYEAVCFAAAAHKGMVRKVRSTPYILHPMEAAVIVGTMTNDPHILAAALLHDAVEDTPTTMQQIADRFGPRVMELVASETEDKHPELPADATWEQRKQIAVEQLKQTEDLGVKMLYLGDKLSNLRSIHRGVQDEGPEFWQRFNQKDPARHHWYYRSIADAIAELSCYEAWQEYDRLIGETFEKEK